MLGLYFVVVILLSDALNVRPGVEFMTGTVALAALALTRSFRLFLKDWWFYLLGLVLWNLSGPVAANSTVHPHLDFMLNADRVLFGGRDMVVVVQRHLADFTHVGPLEWLAAASYNLHLPEPYIAAYFLWRLNRLVYLQFACAVLALLAVGFLTFIFFPAVPPWMASGWYGRIPGVVNGFGPTLRAHPLPFHGTPLFQIFRFKGDAVAAFPSEHAALPMLELLAFARIKSAAFVLFLPWVLWVLFVVVFLGEHWVVDVLAGWLYAVLLFALVVRATGPSVLRRAHARNVRLFGIR